MNIYAIQLLTFGIPWNSLCNPIGAAFIHGELQVLTIVNGEIMGRTFATPHSLEPC